jgi:uncharacterized membrane protein YphA (DoxX/SURF4 family)
MTPGLLRDQRLSLVSRLVLAAFLIAASFGKVTDPWAFADSLRAYALFPDAAIAPAAVMLPWIELIVGIALAAGFPARSAGLVASVLAAGYVVATSAAVARGLNISCGCFGDAGPTSQLGWVDVAWRVALLVLAAHVVAADGLVAQPARLLLRNRA